MPTWSIVVNRVSGISSDMCPSSYDEAQGGHGTSGLFGVTFSSAPSGGLRLAGADHRWVSSRAITRLPGGLHVAVPIRHRRRGAYADRAPARRAEVADRG